MVGRKETDKEMKPRCWCSIYIGVLSLRSGKVRSKKVILKKREKKAWRSK